MQERARRLAEEDRATCRGAVSDSCTPERRERAGHAHKTAEQVLKQSGCVRAVARGPRPASPRDRVMSELACVQHRCRTEDTGRVTERLEGRAGKSRMPGVGRYLIRLDTMWQLILSARVCPSLALLSLHSIALVFVQLRRSVLDDCTS